MKKCSKCGEMKIETDFYRCKSKKDGLQSNCKKCVKNNDKKRVESGENKKRCKEKYQNYLSNETYMEKELARKRSWIKNNIELHREINRNDYINNSFGYMLRASKRREKIISLYNDYTVDDWNCALEYFNNSCAYCGASGNMTKEHFVPVAKNGIFSKDNIIPACSFCNSSKRDRDFKTWYEKQDFYDEEKEKRILLFIK